MAVDHLLGDRSVAAPDARHSQVEPLADHQRRARPTPPARARTGARAAQARPRARPACASAAAAASRGRRSREHAPQRLDAVRARPRAPGRPRSAARARSALAGSSSPSSIGVDEQAVVVRALFVSVITRSFQSCRSGAGGRARAATSPCRSARRSPARSRGSRAPARRAAPASRGTAAAVRRSQPRAAPHRPWRSARLSGVAGFGPRQPCRAALAARSTASRSSTATSPPRRFLASQVKAVWRTIVSTQARALRAGEIADRREMRAGLLPAPRPRHPRGRR